MEIIVLLAGSIILLGIEAMTPGVGIFGISGVICLTLAFFYLLGGGAAAIGILAVFYLVLAAIILFLCWYLPSESRWNPFVLWERQKGGHKDAAALEPEEDWLHRTGRTLSPLRPAGTARIDGKRLDVLTRGEFIPADRPVVVCETEGNKIIVEEIAEADLGKSAERNGGSGL